MHQQRIQNKSSLFLDGFPLRFAFVRPFVFDHCLYFHASIITYNTYEKTQNATAPAAVDSLFLRTKSVHTVQTNR